MQRLHLKNLESLGFQIEESFWESQTFQTVEKNRPAAYPAASWQWIKKRGRQRAAAPLPGWTPDTPGLVVPGVLEEGKQL